jgi:hypothetical protein
MTTLQKLHDHLDCRKRYIAEFHMLDVAPRVVCADGFNMSVQAREHAYCSPRDNNGPWYQVEVGYPSERSELLMPYVEDSERPTQTVYGYVPIEIVAQVIDEHGGFAQ